MANNQYGCLLSMITLTYYALIHWNPMIEDKQESEQQSWEDAVKYLGVMGALAMVLTRGHYGDDEEDRGRVVHRKLKQG